MKLLPKMISFMMFLLTLPKHLKGLVHLGTHLLISFPGVSPSKYDLSLPRSDPVQFVSCLDGFQEHIMPRLPVVNTIGFEVVMNMLSKIAGKELLVIYGHPSAQSTDILNSITKQSKSLLSYRGSMKPFLTTRRIFMI